MTQRFSLLEEMDSPNAVVIVTNAHANISDPDVRKLVDDIIAANELETAEQNAGPAATPEIYGK